jgi:hypothetical protein
LFHAQAIANQTANVDAHIKSLTEQAAAKNLNNDRTWLILLHYKGGKSLIDDPRFFLSPDGRKDPSAELNATISALFSETVTDNENVQCRFPARTAFLRDKLNIDSSRLPAVKCAAYEETAKKIQPRRAVLVFPASFMNKPSSMFGHTFIRLDNDFQSKLLGHAVNYAAHTGDSGGFMYAFKGIFGFFKGYYSVLPYYEKVKEYNDMEQRDIWEYELNLTEAELQRLLMHLWELKDISSPYYFFGENCSSNILFLFEAARPGLHLTDKLSLWVIPADTVRLVRDQGLVAGVKYRPSRATVMMNIAGKLPSDLRKKARDIARGKNAPDNPFDATDSAQDKRETLDLATEAVQYFYAKKEIKKGEFQKTFHRTLTERSKLGPSPVGSDAIPTPEPPDEGHRSYRLALNGGIQKGLAFQEIALRPAYHALTDPDVGYQEGSQLILTDIAARYYPEKGKFRLYSADVVNIVSISPRSTFFSPISWKVSAGMKREYLRDGDDHPMGYGNAGFGLAAKHPVIGLAYMFAEAEAQTGPALRDCYALGGGGSIGILKTITPFWKAHLYAKVMAYGLGETREVYKGAFDQNFRITANTGLVLSLSYTRSARIDALGAKVGLNFFF